MFLDSAAFQSSDRVFGNRAGTRRTSACESSGNLPYVTAASRIECDDRFRPPDTSFPPSERIAFGAWACAGSAGSLRCERNALRHRPTLQEAFMTAGRRTIRTMCPMNCHPTLCGMLVDVEDGNLIGVRGD